MTSLIVILKNPIVLAALQYIVQEIAKKAWESGRGKINNRLVTLMSVGVGTGLGSVTGDPILGAVIGTAAAGLHDVINPRKIV